MAPRLKKKVALITPAAKKRTTIPFLLKEDLWPSKTSWTIWRSLHAWKISVEARVAESGPLPLYLGSKLKNKREQRMYWHAAAVMDHCPFY